MAGRAVAVAACVALLVTLGASCAGQEEEQDAVVDRAWELDGAARRGSVDVLRAMLTDECHAELSDEELAAYLGRARPEAGAVLPGWVDVQAEEDGRHIRTQVIYHYGASPEGRSTSRAFHPASWELEGTTWQFSDCELVRDPQPTIVESG